MNIVRLILAGASSILLTACVTFGQPPYAQNENPMSPDPLYAEDPTKIPVKMEPAVNQDSDETTNAQTTQPAPKKVKACPKKTNTNATSSITPLPAPESTVQMVKQEPIAQPVPTLSNWQPNEALIIRGHELITALQRDIGRKPNASEMQQRLQTHMGLSAAQAQQLIVTLGIN